MKLMTRLVFSLLCRQAGLIKQALSVGYYCPDCDYSQPDWELFQPAVTPVGKSSLPVRPITPPFGQPA